jgi:hypothetical protein
LHGLKLNGLLDDRIEGNENLFKDTVGIAGEIVPWPLAGMYKIRVGGVVP